MSVCITTVVNKKYQKYLSLFIYFCLRSYPEYGVKVLLTDGLVDSQIKYINILKSMGDVEIFENVFEGFPKEGHELKTLRWLIAGDNYMDYENIYIGDIDILLCREGVSLERQHIEHCNSTSLPYSNSVRPGTYRMSGLHFIMREEYYKYTDQTIGIYKDLLKSGALKNCKNEEVLYKIIKESGLCLPNRWFRPHHGIHIGLWRSGPRKIQQKYWDVIGKKDYEKYYEFYKMVINNRDPVFDDMFNINEIRFMEKSLYEEFGDK